MSQFTEIPVRSPQSNTFDLSHKFLTTGDAGFIIPVECVEAIPDDRFSYNNKTFIRLTPLVSPAMADIDVTMVTGFVPMRLIWPNSEKFFQNPVPDANTPVAPYFDNVSVAVGELHDYLGVPTNVYRDDDGVMKVQHNGLDGISALPGAAYQKFYSDWFRDENLINNGEPTFTPLMDGLNPFTGYTNCRRRAWRHDYFTSALPFAQKGDAVEIPLGQFAPVTRDAPNSPDTFARWDTTTPTGAEAIVRNKRNLAHDEATQLLYADLTDATAVTINTLRWATQLQLFLEKNARGGTRYTELIRQHFGVRSSDARLQRAEFLGFSTNPVIISEVLQTSPTTEDSTPLGEMGGHGISYGGSKHVNYFAEEHGFFITVMILRPKSAYMQGLPKMFSRKSPLDYLWPLFAQLGEQEVKNKEIFVQGTEADEGTFGYLPRYAEYRYESDRVSGEMRTSYTHWHMARIFHELPALNQDFIECNPTKRIFAINSAGVHSYIISVRNNLTVRRALPKHGIPAS